MTVRRRIHDWTYRDARRRLVQEARIRLRDHVGRASIDDDANRLVHCDCGWRGNGLGWVAHVDSVVRSAVDSDTVA